MECRIKMKPSLARSKSSSAIILTLSLISLLIPSHVRAQEYDAPVSLRAGLGVALGPNLTVSVADRELQTSLAAEFVFAASYMGRWWSVGLQSSFWFVQLRIERGRIGVFGYRNPNPIVARPDRFNRSFDPARALAVCLQRRSGDQKTSTAYRLCLGYAGLYGNQHLFQ